jgi:hypothetical protein
MHLRGGMCDDTRVLSEAAVLSMQQDRIGAVYDGTSIDPTMPGYGLGWWVDRNSPVISDGGAYGAAPWLELERRYGVMIILEGTATQGVLMRIQVKTALDEIFDARAAQ